MSARPLIAILAVADDGTIGIDGRLPWSIKEDLQRFKRLTSGHAIVMGRKTFDSIGRPLPDRENYVVTTRPLDQEYARLHAYSSPDRALLEATLVDKTPFLIGGAQLYAELWDQVGAVELTEVHSTFETSGEKTTFQFDRSEFVEVARAKSATHPNVEYVTLERRAA